MKRRISNLLDWFGLFVEALAACIGAAVITGASLAMAWWAFETALEMIRKTWFDIAFRRLQVVRILY